MAYRRVDARCCGIVVPRHRNKRGQKPREENNDLNVPVEGDTLASAKCQLCATKTTGRMRLLLCIYLPTYVHRRTWGFFIMCTEYVRTCRFNVSRAGQENGNPNMGRSDWQWQHWNAVPSALISSDLANARVHQPFNISCSTCIARGRWALGSNARPTDVRHGQGLPQPVGSILYYKNCQLVHVVRLVVVKDR